MEGIAKGLGAILVVYVVVDLFFWNGGFVNPSVLQRMTDSMAFLI